MLLAYADESGDTGRAHGASLTYTIGCVFVDAARWPAAFDGLILLRRRLRDTYGLPMRAEVKATALVGGGGAFRDLSLSPAQRGLVYRAHLDAMESIGLRAFGVVIDKRSPDLKDVHLGELAWETTLGRLERTSHYEGKVPFSLTHDEGENKAIRKVARKARRRITAGSAYGSGQIVLAADRLIDDPIPRDSASSYFIQAADLVAYAAFRTLITPGRSVAAVVPQTMWSSLGGAIHKRVNAISGGVPGVVVRTK